MMDFQVLPWIVLGLAALIGLWVAVIHNGLVRHANYCRDSWADIDTELKRRHDLIPNLVETVRGYAHHEEQVLARVIAARNAAASSNRAPRLQATEESALSGEVRRLTAVAERYPDLKADQRFLELQAELTNTEDRIQRARRFYNANVRDLNTRIEMIPSNLVASMFAFRRRDYFEIEYAAEREAPSAAI